MLVGLAYSLTDYLGIAVGLRIPITALLVLPVAWLVVSAVYRCAPRLARLLFG